MQNRHLVIWIVLGVFAWGAIHAVGAYVNYKFDSPWRVWRGVVVLLSVEAFLGFWLLMLWLRQVRPAAVTLLGALNLILGAIGMAAIWTSTAMPSQAFSTAPAAALGVHSYDIPSPFSHAVTFIGLVAMMALFASGIGLLQKRLYGRTLAIIYCTSTLVMGAIGIIVNLAILMTPVLRLFWDVPVPAGADVKGIVGRIIGASLGLAFPTILLFCMYRPGVVGALRRSQASAEQSGLPA